PSFSHSFPTRRSSDLRIGAGYYYGPGQTEDQVQPIESDRVSKVLTGAAAAFPIDQAQIIATYNINNPNLGYQPRVYPVNSYTIQDRKSTRLNSSHGSI